MEDVQGDGNLHRQRINIQFEANQIFRFGNLLMILNGEW